LNSPFDVVQGSTTSNFWYWGRLVLLWPLVAGDLSILVGILRLKGKFNHALRSGVVHAYCKQQPQGRFALVRRQEQAERIVVAEAD
jgi:hypothetical protein